MRLGLREQLDAAASTHGLPLRSSDQRSRIEPRARRAGGRDDAAPVRILAVERRLHEIAVDDRARDRPRLRDRRAPRDVALRASWSRLRRRRPSPRAKIEANRAQRAREVRGARRLRAGPARRRRPQSLVDMSPSTEIMLKLSSLPRAARCASASREQWQIRRDEGQHRRHVGSDHARAFGDAADDVSCDPRDKTRRPPSFGTRSVVMIASAASKAAFAPESSCATARSKPRLHAIDRPAARRSRRSRRRSLASGAMPSSVAAWRAVARASRSPRSPVQALAQPELQTTARIVADSREMLRAHQQRRRLDFVGRHDRRAALRRVENDEREVALARLDARMDSR